MCGRILRRTKKQTELFNTCSSSLNNFSYGEALLSIYLERENTLKCQLQAGTCSCFGSQRGKGRMFWLEPWVEFLLLPAFGRMPECQLCWGWKIPRLKPGPTSRGVTAVQVCLGLLHRYLPYKAVGTAPLFGLDSAEWLGSITSIIYLNMSEIPLKSVLRSEEIYEH